jgi:type IV secretion system protein VirD4
MRPVSRHSASPLPWIAAGGCALVALGVVLDGQPEPQLDAAAPWLVATGVLSMVSAGLVAWSAVGGSIVAAGLWSCAGGWFLRWLPDDIDGHAYWPLLLLAGPLFVAAGLPVLRHGRAGSRGVVQRWAARSRRNGGVASPWQVLRSASRFAVRRKAQVLKPSLRNATTWQRLRTPTTEYATRLARVGALWVWSVIEEVTIRLGGPRTGKTGELGGRILDAPGAVIATSTRTDLIELTGACRSQRGPVYVFNPAGVGGEEYATTITFDPLSDCADPTTASHRAGDMLAGAASPGREGGDREFWESQARRVLAALMHAAALGGLSMRDVLVWVSDPDSATNDVRRLLRRSVAPTYEDDALQFLTTNDRTRSSITATIMPALGWMTDPTAAAAAQGGSFDVAQLLEQRGTVYMLGGEEAQTAPLVAALTGHIARQSRTIAAHQPGGRLDPPLTLALDEAALICPVPLDKWTADMGGRNITIHTAAQSRAQLRQRFGDAGAAAILNNASTLLVFGGTKDPEDLQAFATLTGERDEDVDTYDTGHRTVSTTTRRVPVLTGAQIAQLPPGRVLVIRRDMPVALGRVQMAWKRRDVRREARRAEIERLNALWAERWQQFRDWATPHVLAAAKWVAAQAARVAEAAHQIRAGRAIQRITRTHPKATDRDAQVIAFPPRRDDDEESAS